MTRKFCVLARVVNVVPFGKDALRPYGDRQEERDTEDGYVLEVDAKIIIF